jgi:ubiquinone/menaquinone biosynthesis C-methylase UbiE
MTSALFDAVAEKYDKTFTNTEIGRMQRTRVWNYLDLILPDKPINILELNCGTGEDAIWFAKKGHKVLATDVSEKMIAITRSKAAKLSLSDNISAEVLDINKIDKLSTNNKFDLVFSNFGGLNCLNGNELSVLSSKIDSLLNPKGKFIAVVMPDFCMIESIYFLLKFRMKEIFRRKKIQQVKIDDVVIDTYYYNPKMFYEFFNIEFLISKIIGIGMFIPPSYLNNYFISKVTFLKFLNRLENIFGSHSFSASVSDHYLIDLNIKK